MMQLVILKSSKAPLWLVKPQYLIGKGRDCDIHLSDEALCEVHARLHVDSDKITLEAMPGATVSVGGVAVTSKRSLIHGDYICLGDSEFKILDPKQLEQLHEASALGEESQHWYLQGLTHAMSDKRYRLSGTQLVGRATNCDICLSTAHLSRQHAQLTLNEQSLIVEDLGSSNGTFVNGKRIERASLKNGDELRFDTLSFRVVAPVGDADKTVLRPAVAPKIIASRAAERPAGAKPPVNKAQVGVDAAPRRVAQAEEPLMRQYAGFSWLSGLSWLSGFWWLSGAVLLLAFVVAWLTLS